MDARLDDIAFLGNSQNPVGVFNVHVEAPRSLREIRGNVDAARVTIVRILCELEIRGWIEHAGQEYVATRWANGFVTSSPTA